MKKFLITGASGQIGKALILVLNAKYPPENIIITDIIEPKSPFPNKFIKLDVTDPKAYEAIVKENSINIILHLASILSATGEADPAKTRFINNSGLENAIDMGLKYKAMVFALSSIASFGDNVKTIPNEDTLQYPSTMYGVNKVYMERLGEYYHKKH